MCSNVVLILSLGLKVINGAAVNLFLLYVIKELKVTFNYNQMLKSGKVFFFLLEDLLPFQRSLFPG